MDKFDIDKIERIIKDREYSNKYLLKRNTKTYKSFLELEKNTYATNRLERKFKELIALGISIVQNCESCIEWHVCRALEFGATFDEIFETIDVGIEMGGGPATVSTRFAIKVIEYYKKSMIKELKSEQEIVDCTEVIRQSFKTVADELELTINNAPTHPFNVTLNALKEAIRKGITFFGLQYHNKLIGCIGIEKSKEEYTYYIERLSVLPDHRQKGFGLMLMDFACQFIRDNNGKKVSIGIINGHTILKNWYSEYGFQEKGVKRFDHLPFEVCFMEKEL